MYRIEISSPSGTILTGLSSPNVVVEGWSKRINSAGRMTFSLHKYDAKATETNISMYNRVLLLRKKRDATGEYQKTWLGYIEGVYQEGDRVRVVCAGMLDLFRKRYTGASEQFNGEGSTEAFDLLTATNSNDGDTGIVTGTGGVTTERDLTLNSVEILSAWEEIAMAHDAEFEIDDDGQFNFVDSLGTDQSSTVEFNFRLDGEPGTNVDDVETGEDGRDMANKIIAASSVGGGLTGTYSDATSQTAYGVLIERRTFNDANDQTTLDALGNAYLGQKAYPITDFRVKPTLSSRTFNPISGAMEMSGFLYDDVSLGDLITANIYTQNLTISEAKRVAEIEVEVDENCKEEVSYTLSKSGIFITATLLDSAEIRDMKRRIQELEAAA